MTTALTVDDKVRYGGKLYTRKDNALPTWADRFLRALRRCGRVKIACDDANVSTESYYKWRRMSALFRVECDFTKEEAADALEAEAWRRATEGVRKPLLYRGEVVTDQDGNPIELVEYSDSLLTFMLKGLRKERFGDKTQDAQVNVNVGVRVEQILDAIEEQRHVVDQATPVAHRMDEGTAGFLYGGSNSSTD